MIDKPFTTGLAWAPSAAEKVCKMCIFTWVLGIELCLLEEQYMLLATEPSLQLKRI